MNLTAWKVKAEKKEKAETRTFKHNMFVLLEEKKIKQGKEIFQKRKKLERIKQHNKKYLK